VFAERLRKKLLVSELPRSRAWVRHRTDCACAADVPWRLAERRPVSLRGADTQFSIITGARMKKWLALMTISLCVMACTKQGPLERAGANVDRAVEDVKDGGKKVGKKIGDAAEEVRDAAKDAADDIKK
jgi:hypothetical protein